MIAVRTKTVFTFFLVLVGIVIGTLVASVTANVPALGWLAWSLTFGLENPVILDLSVVKLTFGLNVNLSVAVILCVLVSIIVGRYIDRT